MSDQGDDLGPGHGQISPEERAALKQRSEGIGKRLDEVKSRQVAGRPHDTARGAAYGQAFKIAAELIAGLVFGGAVGWFLDKQFGTLPFLLVLFVMLGFAAGLLNVIRGARQAQAAAEPLQRASPSVADDEDDEK
ncbi:MAG: AtpZ/AtpI family protein [Hyphomicrobium sp.]|nr:AtpZ/AtpI family protein [Hyphomicrobium sp.]